MKCKFKEFNEQYGLTKKALNHESALNTAQLIADELAEFLEEFYPHVEVDVNTYGRVDKPNLHNAFKELEDIRYITGQQSAEYGANVPAVGDETHRSNLSKRIDIYEPDLARAELAMAKKRYPAAELVPHGSYFVIKCAESGKVVKPTTYSPAVITDEMIGL